MDEQTTTPQDDVEAHRQQVRPEFVTELGDRALGRRNPETDGNDDVAAHMIKVPVGKRESIEEDEDVRAHVAGTPGRTE